MKSGRLFGLNTGLSAAAMAAFASMLTQSAHAAATLPPAKVMDVLEYEVGVEIGSAAFEGTYGSDIARAQAAAATIAANMDKRYLHGAGIKHRVGQVTIRTDSATDPLRATVTKGDSSSLSAFKNYWNANASEVGSTHDLAVYHVKYSPSGIAYVNSVGGSYRYALTCGNGETSWADGTLVHEFGHSWNLPHVTNQEHLYESKPRNNSGSHAAGGSDVFVSVMHGGGDHNIGRLATWEASRAYSTRENKRSYGDLITNPDPVRPFGHEDNFSVLQDPITLDVIANDFDCNNDPLDVQILDTVSQLGASITLSAGTGPGGRNELIYTPVSNPSTLKDFFHYTVVDGTGRSDWGCVYVSYDGLMVVDESTTTFNYDLGPLGSPVMDGWSALIPQAFGDVTWSGAAISAVDRNPGGGVNDINRDLIYGSGVSTLNHTIANGIYQITMNMGDTYAHDNMVVKAEGVVKHADVDSAANTNPYANYSVTVTDGELNIEFSDAGGTDPNWVVNRISITRTGEIVDLAKTKYDYDLGPAAAPVMSGWAGITPDTSGDINWSTTVSAVDRGASSGVNDINRDLIYSSSPATLNHKVANGTWQVTMNMGDLTTAHDQMSVGAEGVTMMTGISNTAGSFPYAIFKTFVSDGELNVSFDDEGGSDGSWVVTRMTLANLGNDNKPVATAQSVSAFFGVAKAITLAGIDADGDTLTYTVLTQPTHGTLSGTAPNMSYTATAGYTGSDSFTFVANDGHIDSAAATVSVDVTAEPAPVGTDIMTVDTALRSFNYDFGTASSAVQSGWTRISPDAGGDITWSSVVDARDRGTSGGANNINRDFVFSSNAVTLEHKVANGSWHIVLNMGDADNAHDNMIVKAEGVTMSADTDSAANSFPYVIFDTTVTDGSLSIEFSDGGGSDANWVVTRFSLSRNADAAPVGSMVAFKAQANNKYVCSDNRMDGTNRTLLANRTAVGSWEKFTVADAGDGYVSLVANYNSKYVRADVALNATNLPLAANHTGALTDAEKYMWWDNGDGTVSLQSKANNKFVAADQNLDATNWPTAANTATIEAKSKFTVEVQ